MPARRPRRCKGCGKRPRLRPCPTCQRKKARARERDEHDKWLRTLALPLIRDAHKRSSREGWKLWRLTRELGARRRHIRASAAVWESAVVAVFGVRTADLVDPRQLTLFSGKKTA